jgi:hypothetical protein
VSVVKGGVVNEPVVPVPPPPDEVHESLTSDDQVIMEVPPIATFEGEAVTVTCGGWTSPHEESPETANSPKTRTLRKTIETAMLLSDMMVSLQKYYMSSMTIRLLDGLFCAVTHGSDLRMTVSCIW